MKLIDTFKDDELIEESNVQNLHIAGLDKPVKSYNPDVITLSVIASIPNAVRNFVNGQPQRGVHIELIKEHLIFTDEDSPMANLMLSVMGALAEFERALLKECQREGIVLAKQRGAYRGRKKSLSQQEIAMLRQRAADGENKTMLAREFGISRETLYQYLRAPE